MPAFLDLDTLALLVHLSIVGLIHVRVIMMRPEPGVALAWLLIVTLVPALGVLVYLLFGERRIGRRRAQRIDALRTRYEGWFETHLASGVTEIDWARHQSAGEQLDRLGKATAGIPTMRGNRLEIFSDTQEILRAIIADVERARSTIHMAFYIWHPGGTADEVVDAVVRAAERGVRCRILVDHLGGGEWLRGEHRKRLVAAGASVAAALPAGLWRSLFARGDLRLHRKIVVIDGELAYTGSMNLVDPRYFKAESGVGEWVDAMARIEGPCVEALLGVLLSDWQLETGEDPEHLIATSDMQRIQPLGGADVQVIPSGPGAGRVADTILQMLVRMIYAAREELVITTPYFVPDVSMLRALRSVAAQGVRVVLIVPAKVDSLLVRYASRSYYADLIEAGVEILKYESGLLHTKSITVDGRLSMFGTVNLDMRSLWLNYEVSLFVYDEDFGGRLRALQEAYVAECVPVVAEEWSRRSAPARLVENSVRLVSPLL
jgi:cardiolipin synthase